MQDSTQGTGMEKDLHQGGCQPGGFACLPFPGAAPSSRHAPAVLCTSQVSLAPLCSAFRARVTVTAQGDGKKALLKGMKAGTHRSEPARGRPCRWVSNDTQPCRSSHRGGCQAGPGRRNL